MESVNRFYVLNTFKGFFLNSFLRINDLSFGTSMTMMIHIFQWVEFHLWDLFIINLPFIAIFFDHDYLVCCCCICKFVSLILKMTATKVIPKRSEKMSKY